MPEKEKKPDLQKEVVESLSLDNKGSLSIFTEFEPKNSGRVFAARVIGPNAVITDISGAFSAPHNAMIAIQGNGLAAMLTEAEFAALYQPVEPKPEKKKAPAKPKPVSKEPAPAKPKLDKKKDKE